MFQYRKFILYWIALVACLSPIHVHARGVSPYLPEKLSPMLEREVERLAVVAGIGNLTKPYSIASIFHHMESIKTSHPALYSRLLDSLIVYDNPFTLTHVKARLGYSDDTVALPNSRGNYTNELGLLSLRGQWQMADWMAIYSGAHLSAYRSLSTDQNPQMSGSTFSIGTSWAQLDIGYKDFWMSPFQGSAQLLSTNAQTMPSISLSNNLPIEFLGLRWHYQGLLAQMSEQPVVFEDERNDDEGPLLAGLHVSVQPTSWLTFGASRMFQFAGGKRDKSFKTLLRAFFDPRGVDNDAGVDEESGNQIAAVSSRIYFDGRLPFSFALELAGEDTSNNKSYQLGNTALTAGWFFPYFFSESLSFTYEYSDWQNAWYANNVYPEDGYANEGFVLGHWAMQDQRDMRTETEGTSHYLKSVWQHPGDHVVSFIYRSSEHEDSGSVDYQYAWNVELEYAIPVGLHIFSVGLLSGKNSLGTDFSRISVSLEW